MVATSGGWRAATMAVAAFGLAFGLLGLLAAPASAHGRGSDATNFRSDIIDEPAVDGVRWQVHGGDELLELSSSEAEVLVSGYEGEPYLRVGPDGVFENRRSPATYLNRERFLTQPPQGADASAEPEWEQVSGAASHAWHDHRIHWMSPQLPPAVRGAGEAVLVQQWQVPFLFEDRALELSGELWWIPPPSPWPWLAVALLLVAPALAGFRTHPSDGRWSGLARPAAAVLAVLAVLNLTHLIDDLVAMPLPLSTALLAAVQTALFTAIVLFGAVRGWQARDGAFTALGVGAGALLIGQGLLYAGALGASQVTSIFPDAVARLVIALSIAQAPVIGAVAIIGTRRLLPEVPGEARRARQPAR